MDNETENALTIGEVCRIVWKRILYVLAASVLVAVVALLVFMFAINPSKVSYSGEFFVTYPSKDTQKYPDGSPLFYHDIISKSSLEAVVSSDGQLKGVNVGKLLEEEGISFTAELDGETGLYTGKYSIAVKGSYFSDYEQAKLFVTAISQAFVTRINTQAEAVDYKVDSELFVGMSYEMQLKSLAEQKAKLLAELDKWITIYHESYKVNGKTLKNYRVEIEAVYGGNIRKTLEVEWDRCGYVPVAETQARVEQLKAQIEYNDKQIAALEDAINNLGLNDTQTPPASNASAVSMLAAGDSKDTDDPSQWVISIESASDLLQTLAKFVTQNEQLKYQSELLAKDNYKESVEAFEKSLHEQYEQLSEKADTLAEVTRQIYKDNSRVLASEQVLKQSGSTSIVLVAAAGFVLAFVVAAVVVFCIDAPKYKANKLKKAEEPAPVEEKPEEEQTTQE